MKKLIAFDLDGTLAPSKSPADPRMLNALEHLLGKFQVCVISGGKFEQFNKQLLNGMNTNADLLKNFHMMPTCGTRYMVFNPESNGWDQVYAEDFTAEEKTKIINALNKGFDDLDMRAEKTYGETIEDRGSQITFSVLGQDIVDELGLEGVRIKEEWDANNEKKNKLRDYIQPLIPDFEVRVGGLTSMDVTKKGVDKAYGMQKLMEILGIEKDDILFIGDRVQPGGNDYPVKEFGIDTLQISRWEETAAAVEAIVHVA
jgi:phosphomannomutase